MERVFPLRLKLFGSLLAAFALLMLIGCAGVSSNSQKSQQNLSRELAASPSSMSFGTVAVGKNATQTGTLTASNSDVHSVACGVER